MTDLPAGRVIHDVAVFPLERVVLFPGTLLPLHIFEPRYRVMTRDALSGTGLLVIAQIPDGARVDEIGHPDFCRIATVGAITHHDALPDGRFNILVQGAARVALEELPFKGPYRRARARVLETTRGVDCRAEAQALTLTATEFAQHVRDTHPSFDFSLDASMPPGAIADQVAHYLVVDPGERQVLLETLDEAKRVGACLEALMRQSARLSPGGVLN